MKQVYILLSRTNSVPSRLIHLCTNKQYTHVSIAIEPKTNKFCSYGRRRMHNVLVGGLVHEDISQGVFALYPNSPCQLFSLEVDDESYIKLKHLLNYYFKHYNKCKYNFKAFITMSLQKKQDLKFKMVCSQFVAKILRDSGACTLPKHPSLMQPSDFMLIDKLQPIYKGKIKDFHFPDEVK